MKLILAIVNNDDAYSVNSHLSKEGFIATKISSTGGFLMNGNSTFLMGVTDERVEECIALIGKYSRKRIQAVPSDLASAGGLMTSTPAEITVGGATVFVLNVEEFRRV